VGAPFPSTSLFLVPLLCKVLWTKFLFHDPVDGSTLEKNDKRDGYSIRGRNKKGTIFLLQVFNENCFLKTKRERKGVGERDPVLFLLVLKVIRLRTSTI
jgi:hypothetical protein